jgi:hypothetical protein
MPDTGQGATWPAEQFIGIVAIFLLAGPPAGGIAVWVSVLGIDLFRGGLNAADLRALPGVILLSYPYGGPFALACGIAHASTAIWLRRNSVLVPLIAGSVLSVVDMLVFGLPELEIVMEAVVAPMFTASLLCWRLTRRLARGA